MPRPGIKQQQLDQHHQAEENVDLGRVADEVVVNAQQKDQQSEQAGQQPGAGYQLVGIVQAADEPYNLFSPCLRTFILRPLIGIITKTDSPYANVPMIIKNGAGWYSRIGTPESPGTKAFALTGNVKNTGLIEVPMGITLREIIFDIGGGIKDNKKFKAVQIGGPSGGCLVESQLDSKMDFDSLSKIGAMIGSGGLVVMDEDTCMVEVARFFMNFTQRESCGKCVPCREGTKRMLEILERIVAGNGKMSDLDELEELADMIENTALCGLGKSAPKPVISTIHAFRKEYEEHILDKKCRAHVCSGLRVFKIDPEKCKGCSNCPVNAISGKVKSPFVIDNEKCVKCGSCMDNCAFGAIYTE